MALDARILDTSIIGQTAKAKIDLVTPVNIYKGLQANRRANKLSELTLSKEIKTIYMDPAHVNENGTKNAESMISAFKKAGHPDAAYKIQDQMFKVDDHRQKIDKEMSRM